MSKCVTVSGVKNPYDIIIGKDVMSLLPDKVKECTKAKTMVIITDDNVDKLYSDKVKSLFENEGFRVLKFVFEHGEDNKSIKTLWDILEYMADNNVTRSDCIIALGGGITGDISGYAAASYLRGIDFIQVPTSFLAAIDSSVGGKTGVNLKSGKNLAGAFYQPKAVICDTTVFSTLPEENFKEGVAEAIKYGAICDNELFLEFLNNDNLNIENIIEKCVSIKAEIVSEDEFDLGTRQLLNFGHTIGHAIEKCSEYKISHGIAVGIGMAMICKISDRVGWSFENTYDLMVKCLKKNNLPIECDIKSEKLLSAIFKDKKRSADTINLVIPEKIGACRLKKINVSELEALLKE